MIKLNITPQVVAALSASLLTLGSGAQAQTLLDVKIGTTANDGSANGAYQETGAAVLGSANSWWNEYAYVSSTPNGVSVVDSSDSALSGVTLTVANTSGVGHVAPGGSNPSFLFADMPYQNAGAGDVFNISLAGLAANTKYEFVGYAADPGISAGASWTVTAGTLDSGTTLNDGSSVDITTGVGKAYSDFFVTTTGSGTLAITDAGNHSGTSDPVLAGFQLELAPTPEPGSWMLMLGGVGMLFVYRRFRFSKAA